MNGGAPSEAPHRFAALDSLRGVAARVVAAEHLNAQGPLFGQRFFVNGLLFVDFFFALSGFVIAAAYADRLVTGFPRARFLWLRVGRVWPVHAVMLAAYLAVELVGSSLTGREAFGPVRSLPDLGVQLLLLQSLWTPSLYTWLLQSWSISVELVLYVVAAFGWRAAGKGWWRLSLLFAVIAAAAMLFPEFVGLHHKLLRGFSGFGFGVVAYVLWQRFGVRLAAVGQGLMTLLEIALVLAVVLAVAMAGDDAVFGLYGMGFALVVLIFAAGRGHVSWLLLTRPLVFLGTVSYSLYMVHTLAESAVLSIAARLAVRLGHAGWFVPIPGNNRPAASPELGVVADLISAGALVFAVLAAWILYRLVEHPARQWSRRIAPRIGKPA